MFKVILYFINSNGFHSVTLLLKDFCFEKLPNDVIFIALLNEKDEIRHIFLINDRGKLKKCDSPQKLCFHARWYETYLCCEKAKVYLVSMYHIRVIFKILVEARSSVYRKLSRRIEGYVQKKNIPVIEQM